MATNTDVMINVEANIGQLLKDLQNVEKALKQTQTTINNQLNPSTQTFGNRVTAAGSKVKTLGTTIKQKIGTEGAIAFAAVGAAAMSFTKQCIQSAISAESAWTQMNALLNDSTGQTGITLDEAKSKIRSYANEWGYTVGDVRAAGNSLLLTGLDNDQLMLGLQATAGVAARTGKSMEDASTLVSRALAGNGRDFERLTGLRLKDYKTADGQIDKERLLTDLYNQNTGAIQAHSDTTEAAVNRMNTAWGKFKTEIGNALLPVVKIVGEVVEKIADWFSNLPEPAKQFIAAILLITGAVATVIGVLGFLAPIFIAGGEAIMFVGGIIGTVIGFVSTLATVIGSLGIVGSISLLFEILSGAALLLLDALLPIIVPVLAIVAALALLYVFGQKMGWWNDLTGMLQKFGEVIMWVAGQIGNFFNWVITLFTDFPTAMSQAGAVLGNFKQIIINALSGLAQIGINAAQEFWNGLQQRFTEITGAIGETVSKIPGIIAEKLSDLGNMIIPGGGLTAGILAIFMPLPTLIYAALSRIAPIIQEALMNAANFARMYAQRIVQTIVTRFNLLVARVRQIFLRIVTTIRSRLTNALTIAGNLVNRIRNAIVTRFNVLVARVRNIFTRIVSQIRQKLSDAVSSARQKAQEILDGIRNKIQQVPQIFADEFGKIKERIQTAINNAKQVAVSSISDLVQTVKSILGIASPGYIQRMFTYEFTSIPRIILEQGTRAVRNARDMASNIVETWTDSMGDGLSIPLPDNEETTFSVTRKILDSIPRIPSLGADALSYSYDKLARTPQGNTTNTSTQNNTTVTNAQREIHYHNETIHVNMNELPRNEREEFYNLLSRITSGSV